MHLRVLRGEWTRCFPTGLYPDAIEPQNTEQGIMNVEVLMNQKTSYFYIPCSILDIQRGGQALVAIFSNSPASLEIPSKSKSCAN